MISLQTSKVQIKRQIRLSFLQNMPHHASSSPNFRWMPPGFRPVSQLTERQEQARVKKITTYTDIHGVIVTWLVYVKAEVSASMPSIIWQHEKAHVIYLTPIKSSTRCIDFFFLFFSFFL